MRLLTRSEQDPFVTIKADSMASEREVPHRKELSEILVSYNRKIGNDDVACNQAKRLGEKGVSCVITGQQLGVMGGPLYTILKAISTLLLAKERAAVPVFWWATEDHDIDEIDHADIVDEKGNLSRCRLLFKKKGLFVEDLVLTEEHIEVLRHFLQAVSCKHNFSFRVGERYADAMLRVMAWLFKGTGLVFVEPQVLRRLAVPFFRQQIIERDRLHQVFTDASRKLKQPVLESYGPCHLFYKDDRGKRVRLSFEEGEKVWLERLQKEPERFSSDAISRPVMQNALFPTLAYVAGPTEIRYHEQLKEYHAAQAVAMPSIVSRLSMTWIPRFEAQVLNAWDIEPWECQIEAKQGMSPAAVHQVRNTIFPKGRLQERVVNIFGLVADPRGIIKKLVEEMRWNMQGHHYLWIDQ